MSDIDAGAARAKAEYVMKIGMLLKAGELSNAEAAQKLGLSQADLDEVLRGQRRDVTMAKISGHLNQRQDEPR
jgi:predicted XRE-type DNA-binding protein